MKSWFVNLIASVITAIVVAGFVISAGGPKWAGIGFGLVTYLTVLPIPGRSK
jgi:hypothetical protein